MTPKRHEVQHLAARINPVSAAVALAVGSLTITGPAQSANVFTEEMVVTATRRAIDTQDVPFNISAYSGDALQEYQIEDLNQFARWVPGLTVADQGLRTANTMTVRGLTATSVDAAELLGNGSGNTVGVYLGEVPLYVDLKLVDLERVEVLMGPQGTLFGEGTLGGAVRYIPKKPRTDETTLEVHGKGYGMSESDDAGWSGDVVFNVPIVRDRLAFRGNVGISEIPGFIDYNNLLQSPGTSNPEPSGLPGDTIADNLISQRDADGGSIFNARAGLLWNIGKSGELLVSYNYQDMDMNGKTANNAASFDTGKYVSGYRYMEPNQRENHLASATLIWDFDFAELTSTVGYSKFDETGQRDQTDLLLNIGYTYPDFPEFSAFTADFWEDETVTFETRLVSNIDSKLNWIGGVFYSDIDNKQLNQEFTPGFTEWLGIMPPTGNLEYNSATEETIEQTAVFGEIGYQFTERWQATVGARWFKFEDDLTILTDFPIAEFQGFVPPSTPTSRKVDDSDVIFKFNTSLDIDGMLPRMNSGMTYLTISEGYRLGGVNAIDSCPVPLPPGQLVCVLPGEESFETDTTLNYEVGIKTAWVDSRLNSDLALFYIDWSDVQIDTITVVGDSPIKGNSGDARSMGVEFSIRYQINDHWGFYGSYAYTDIELTKDAPNSVGVRFGLPADAFEGDRLPGTPQNQGAFNVNYNRDIFQQMFLQLDYGLSSISNVYTKTGLRGSGEILPGFTLHSASITLGTDIWSAQLFTKNMFNKFATTGVRRDPDYIDKRADGNGIYPPPGEAFTLRQYHHNVIQPRTIGVDFRYNFDFGS